MRSRRPRPCRLAHLAAGFCLLAGPACSSPVGPITEVVVSAIGLGPQAEQCQRFSLTPQQVRAFFDRAVLISARQQHDFFLYGPCQVRGTLRSRYDHWQWQIRNLGTGSLEASNGEVFLFGDPEQESPLGED